MDEIEIYRGDTFKRKVTPKDFMFEKDDKIRIGIKTSEYAEDYVFLKEHVFTDTKDSFIFTFSAEEMAKLKPNKYKFEIEVTHKGHVKTMPQKILNVKRDVVV